MPVLYMLLAGIAGVVLHHEWTRWREDRCDACRIERNGGTLGRIPHTCSRKNALFRDRKGRVTEFGQHVRTERKAGDAMK